jgi:microcystin-dependent protein
MEGYIAEIRMFAGNFAPRAWFLCQGQLLSIAQYTALFALVGTTYGGDGQTTFGLPDFRGRIGVGMGQGPGLSNYVLGQESGVESVTLASNNLPAHTHTATLTASATTATAQGPGPSGSNRVLGRALDSSGAVVPLVYAPAGSPLNSALGAGSVTTASTGGNLPFSTLQPYLGMNFIICAEGIFPSRS